MGVVFRIAWGIDISSFFKLNYSLYSCLLTTDFEQVTAIIATGVKF